jgi:protein-disulfide isomerase
MRRPFLEAFMAFFRSFSNPSRAGLAGLLVLLAGSTVFAAAPAKSVWLTTFARTATGGHVIGNPKAANHVVEYLSYTCGHCAHFDAVESPKLKDEYVATGKLRYEIRNLVRDPMDLTASMIARCGGAGRFFGNVRQLMATQKQWASEDKLSAATKSLLEKDDLHAFLQAAYGELGLDTVMAARGITPAQAKICLADKRGLEQVFAMTDEAVQKYNMPGTPGFLVNGKVAEAGDAATLATYFKR